MENFAFKVRDDHRVYFAIIDGESTIVKWFEEDGEVHDVDYTTDEVQKNLDCGVWAVLPDDTAIFKVSAEIILSKMFGKNVKII